MDVRSGYSEESVAAGRASPSAHGIHREVDAAGRALAYRESVFRALRPSQVLVDLVAAGVCALVLIPIELSGVMNAESRDPAAGSAVAIVLALALGLRRLSPGLSLSIAWCAAIGQMVAGLAPRPSDVVIFAVLYATAAYGRRLVFWLGFVSALVGALVITLYLVFAPTMNVSASWPLQLVFVVFIAALFALLLSWVTGALVRTARRAGENRQAKEAAEAEAAAEHERGRIARDMHDVVAHSLAVVIAQADGARYAIAAASGRPAASASSSREHIPAVAAVAADSAADALATIASTARSALSDVRLLLTQLRHSEGVGPQPTLVDLDGLYGHVRAAGLDVRVDVDPAPRDEPRSAVQLAVFRILQEALTNALRHGDGGAVDVSLAWHDDRVQLSVTNRIGAAPAVGDGHGLVGMRERAQLAGGVFEAGAEGATFVVRATLPTGGSA